MRGPAVEPRTSRVGVTSCSRAGSEGSAIRSSRRAAASEPASRGATSTLVRPDALHASEEAVVEADEGDVRRYGEPELVGSRHGPHARRGRWPRRWRSAAAVRPRPEALVRTRDRRPRWCRTRRCARTSGDRASPSSPGSSVRRMARSLSLGSGDVADPAMPELVQVLQRQDHAESIVLGDDIRVRQGDVTAPGHHGRQPGGRLRDRGRPRHRAGQHEAVDRRLHEGPQQALVGRAIEPPVAEERVQTAVVQQPR